MNAPTKTPLSPAARLALAKRERPASSMLPYFEHADPATILMRDGALMQCFRLEGLASETAEADELNYRKNVRDAMLRGLGSSRLTVYHHVLRRRIEPQAPGSFTNDFAERIDAKRREQLNERKLYTNELFLTLLRRPAAVSGGAFAQLFGARAPQDAAALAREKRELESAGEILMAALAAYRPRRLTAYQTPRGIFSEPLEFLACLYNGEMRPMLADVANIAEALPQRRVSFGFDALELAAAGGLERTFAAMVSVKEYPAHTTAGQLDALLGAPCELVLSESFAFVDRQAGLDRMNLALRRMRAADDEAISQRQDLTRAKDAVAGGRAAFGEHHLTVMVKAESLRDLDIAVSEVQAAFSEIGAVAVREDIALEPSFWAQFPGNRGFIPRRALISSANFASLASCHNPPAGSAEGNHWGPAVTVLETAAASPYYFNFHRGDLGNFIIVGPSGSGKTVMASFLLAQAQRFDPRIVFFDKDRGAEMFLRAMGGRYSVLRHGKPSRLNPLLLPDTPGNRRFLQQWLACLLTINGETLGADDLAVIAEAVAANFDQPEEYRRLRYLREMLIGARRPAMGDLASRLAPWVGDGDRAWLFDNARDELDLSDAIVGFDMTQILDDPPARVPAMMYFFHRVEERLDGRPSVIVIDEGWKALDDEIFLARIRDWERTIRKRNGIVGFLTQSASDALESRIASAVIEQSPTQIFMPNPKAQEADYCGGFGLTRHEFEIVRTLPDTSRCFLLRHGPESVVARLDLSGLGALLAILSADERQVRRMDALRAESGDDPARWLPQILEGAR
jgi:type IV secretion system protein VirB4